MHFFILFQRIQDTKRLMSREINVGEENLFEGHAGSNTSCHETETSQSGSDVFNSEFLY